MHEALLADLSGEFSVRKLMNNKLDQSEIKVLPEDDIILAESEASPNSPLEVPASVSSTYQPYPWQPANQLLAFIDAKTSGKAGQIQRIISYLFFGGLASIVNLLVFALMLYLVHFPSSVSAQVHNIIAYVVAAECSIMANFLPNDRFTFSSLPGAKRPWWQRCLRFHATCIVGAILTFLIEFALFNFAGVTQLLSEAVAIVIVLIYNFTFHNLFTYRHIKN
jgi:putative flippase GtrA